MKESQLENKTSIATNDYVRMVDKNGNSVKIKKDSFMAAIRDALPSIISDGSTNGGSVLSIINGALKTRTDANLASVLGGDINGFKQAFAGNVPSSNIIKIDGNVGAGKFLLFEAIGMHTNDAPSYIQIYSTQWNRGYIAAVADENSNKFTVFQKDHDIYLRYNKSSYGRVYIKDDTGKALQYTIVDSIPSDAAEVTIVQKNFGCSTPSALASLLGEAGIVFQKTNTSGVFSNVVRVSMNSNAYASITLLVTRNFYNLPAFAAIIQIGRNTGEYGMNVIVPSGGISFSFDNTNGNITIGHNNQGNGLGTIRITILQRSTGAKFIGEVDN